MAAQQNAGAAEAAVTDATTAQAEPVDADEITTTETVKSMVRPSTLELGQVPDCSNVLQNRGYLDSMTYVFGAWASEYTRLGLLVVGFNQPGMGSPGTPGLCESWTKYIDNVLFATDTAVRLLGGTWTASGHPDVPVFIYGQSMGGALATEATRRRPNAYRGVILSAPMCGIAPDSLPNDCSIAMLRCMEAIAPTAALVPQEDILERCFKCKAQIKRVRARADEIGYPKQPLLRTGVQLFDATLDIQAHVGDFAPPSVLLIQGSLDKVTDGQLTREYIRGCGAGDKTYITYKNAWHALEWEPVDTRMALIHDLTYWVAARVDAWEEGNAELAAALRGRAAVPVEPWGGAAQQNGSILVLHDAPAASSSAGRAPATVALGPMPAGDSDMQWREEDGVLWGEREEGTGMIPDHDEISFYIVRSGGAAAGGEGGAVVGEGAGAVALDQTVNSRDDAALVKDDAVSSPV